MRKWSRYQYFTNRPLGKNGETITGCEEHKKLSAQTAEEGAVLLKNNGILPLQPENKIAVFGKFQQNYIACGGGSGAVISEPAENIYDALKLKASEGKLCLYEPLGNFYKNYVSNSEVFKTTDEPEIDEELLVNAAKNCDVAIMVLGRFSEETKDRLPKKGDYYLSDSEEKLLTSVCNKFQNTIVLLNTVGIIDTTPFLNNERVGGLFVLWNGGSCGGKVAASLLCGDVCPSGKLPDTFAASYTDYPSAASFSESDYYTKYYEDIYVGYRYFETIPETYKKVNFPFGFGLSYTTFEIFDIKAKAEHGKIIVSVSVKNTGKVSGKEVVQVYYSAPCGLLGKPARELAAFEKTPLLAPGKSCSLTLDFDINSMASYDDTGKIKAYSYILEKGVYNFYVGNSVRDTFETEFKYELSDDIVTELLSSQCAPVNLEKRLLSSGEYEKLPKAESKHISPKIYSKTDDGYSQIINSLEGKKYDEKLLLSDICDEPSKINKFISQFSVEQMELMLGGQTAAGVSDTCGIGNIPEFGVPTIMTADGPAGLRVCKNAGTLTTCFPSATTISSTWNKKLAYEIGKTIASEAKENNVGIFLAPAMNIHRDPLCGRNFEYYSEDPVLTGIIATETVKGIQSLKISATIKHFACNNRETNRRGCDSVLSERALREIYLKGFEIAVKNADPWLIMTSYNPINGVQASENYELITNILRGEWNYNGAVTSDWLTAAMHYKEALAGNDLKMPYKSAGSISEAIRSWCMTRDDVEKCIKRILNLIIKLAE